MTESELADLIAAPVTDCSCGHSVGSHAYPTKADDSMPCRYCDCRRCDGTYAAIKRVPIDAFRALRRKRGM